MKCNVNKVACRLHQPSSCDHTIKLKFGVDNILLSQADHWCGLFREPIPFNLSSVLLVKECLAFFPVITTLLQDARFTLNSGEAELYERE